MLGECPQSSSHGECELLEEFLEKLLDHLHDRCSSPRLEQLDCLDHQVARSHDILKDLHLGLDHPRRLWYPDPETPVWAGDSRSQVPETPGMIARRSDLQVEGVQLVFGSKSYGCSGREGST
jgi:hypothetical protein